ncbi:MAG: molybdate ABC transporter substrate-binding protein [Hyphomonadaceae bacterium]
MTVFRCSLVRTFAVLALLLTVGCSAPNAEKVPTYAATLAVASNFRPAMEHLKAEFEQETGYTLSVSYGATGQFFAQIQSGAPFDVFLAADTLRPSLLQGIGTTPRTYAIGQLALWSPVKEPVSSNTLNAPDIRHIAMANPDLAPYGTAALDVINHLGIRDDVTNKLVRGENVGQAFVFAQTGNADLGFVALSQILALPENERGAYWLPSSIDYAPIRQDALLLDRGRENAAATSFFDFLYGERAREIIANSGYKLP